MKKIRNLIIILLVFLGIIAISNNVNAATSSVTLQKIEVTSPSGTYTTGQEITIVATFSGNVVGTGNNPSITLKFGTSELYGTENVYGTISGNTVIFKHTIITEDSGVLTLKSLSGLTIKDEDGNYIDMPTNMTLSGSSITANPFTWSDASNVKATIDDKYNMKITDLGTEWYAYVTNGKNPPTIDQFDAPTGYTFQRGSSNGSNSVEMKKILEKSGDIYLYIVERKKNYEVSGKQENKIILSDFKVERPTTNNLSQRVQISLNNDKITVTVKEPHDEETTRKATIKIGTVSDKEILSSVKNGDLTKLLSYAKIDSNAILTQNISVDAGYSTGEKDISSIKGKLINKAYYYIYIIFDDENGKYYPLEDVSFAQAISIDGTITNLTHTVTWDAMDETETPSTNEPTDSTITPDNKLPQTGATVTIIAIIGITAVIAVVAGIKLKKYNF